MSRDDVVTCDEARKAAAATMTPEQETVLRFIDQAEEWERAFDAFVAKADALREETAKLGADLRAAMQALRSSAPSKYGVAPIVEPEWSAKCELLVQENAKLRAAYEAALEYAAENEDDHLATNLALIVEGGVLPGPNQILIDHASTLEARVIELRAACEAAYSFIKANECGDYSGASLTTSVRRTVRDLLAEIDAVTAERDAAQHAEVSLHMRLTKLTAERDEARELASAYVHKFEGRSSGADRQQLIDLALVNSWHRPEEKP